MLVPPRLARFVTAATFDALCELGETLRRQAPRGLTPREALFGHGVHRSVELKADADDLFPEDSPR